VCRRCIFDIDSIDIGPERRQYLDHQLSRLWENNSQVPCLLLDFRLQVCRLPANA